MNREALERLFPEAIIKSRKGPFGQSFSYVEGAEYIRRLNEAFDAEWSFEIVEHHIRETEVIVIGKLTAGTITKMAFGGSNITVSREGEIISLADDLKAAATDALKKASSLLGVGLHLYSDGEPKYTTGMPSSSSNGKSNGSNGNGHRPNGNGVSRDRITQRQLSAIWALARSLGLSSDAVRERASMAFGVLPEQLSKNEASAFISELTQETANGGGA
jgi:hypothetical protein